MTRPRIASSTMWPPPRPGAAPRGRVGASMIPVKDNIPLLRFPLITAALVLGNVVVYVLAVAHGGSVFGGPSMRTGLRYGAIPSQLDWKAAFTSQFVHASFLQLLANTIALALFGLNVEDATGRLRFIVLYLLGGLLALALAALLAPNSSVPVLGASGAVAAVLGGYLLLYPRARVIGVALIPFLATIVEVPAALLIGVWLLAQAGLGLAGLTSSRSGDWAIAYAATLGAMLFGALVARLLADRSRRAAKRRPPPPQPVY
jgi:membrane associated rhomboid family serine protease